MSDSKTYLVVWPDHSSVSHADVHSACRQAQQSLKDSQHHKQLQVYAADFDKKELTLVVTYRLRSIEGPLKVELI